MSFILQSFQILFLLTLSRILHLNPPMAISKTSFTRPRSRPLQPRFHPGRKGAEGVQPLGHGVVHIPPSPVSQVVREDLMLDCIPIAIVVPIAHPWLITQIVNRQHLRHFACLPDAAPRKYL